MTKVMVTYSPEVGGSSVISLKESFIHVGSEVIDGDFRKMMEEIPKEEFDSLYTTQAGRLRLFAHAKAKAIELLKDVDVLALSGNTAMIDPELFHKTRQSNQQYDFSRTLAELALVHIATQRGMPILGVCGGHQVIAVHGGGTITDLNSDKLDKQKFMNYDAIKLNKTSMLAQILGKQKVHRKIEVVKQQFDAKIPEFNRLQEKIVALNELGATKDVQALDKSKLQALLEQADLSNVEQIADELNNLSNLLAQLSDISSQLNKLKREIEGIEEVEFFGAHNQVVSKMGAGFKQTAIASDDESIEAAESAFGSPIITTQFHPEVGAKGLPNAKMLYKKSLENREMNLDIFRFLNKAGTAYSQMRAVRADISLFKLGEKNNSLRTNESLSSERTNQQQADSSSSWWGLSLLSSIFNYLKESIIEKISAFLRNRVSDILTGDRVSKLKKNETEQSNTESPIPPSSSFISILNDIKKQTPAEMFSETHAQLWTKLDDDRDESEIKEDEQVVNSCVLNSIQGEMQILSAENDADQQQIFAL